MKAVQIDACGDPGNMVLRDIATSAPGAGEAPGTRAGRVRVQPVSTA